MATAFGHSCPQQDSNVDLPLNVLAPQAIEYLIALAGPPITDQNEDCTTSIKLRAVLSC